MLYLIKPEKGKARICKTHQYDFLSFLLTFFLSFFLSFFLLTSLLYFLSVCFFLLFPPTYEYNILDLVNYMQKWICFNIVPGFIGADGYNKLL